MHDEIAHVIYLLRYEVHRHDRRKRALTHARELALSRGNVKRIGPVGARNGGRVGEGWARRSVRRGRRRKDASKPWSMRSMPPMRSMRFCLGWSRGRTRRNERRGGQQPAQKTTALG